MLRKHWKMILAVTTFLAITGGAFFLAGNINENEWLTSAVKNLGLVGTIVIGIVCGLNAFVPIPPATFAPLFIESGLSPLLVILGFVIGTTIADSIGYLIGRLGQGYVKDNHPKVTNYLLNLFKSYERLIPVFLFIYFAIAPLPNEIILIPLALIGYKYKKLIVPLIIGNVIHHTMMVFGYSTVFSWFF